MGFECPIPRSREPDVADNEERTSLWPWSLFLAQLHALWRSLLDRVRQRVGSPSTPAGTLMAWDEERDTAEIRRLYRRLLKWAAARGHSRPPSCTPHEFAGELRRASLSCIEAISTITDFYGSACYGGKRLSVCGSKPPERLRGE
jgi:hypothetical protein